MTSTVSNLIVILACSALLVYWVAQTFLLLYDADKPMDETLAGTQTDVAAGLAQRNSA